MASDKRFYSVLGTASSRRMQERAGQALDAIVALIAREQLDIVALQEVDVSYGGRSGFAQHERLAADLGWHAAFEPAYDYHLGPFANVTTGLATLSRFPIRLRRRINFPQRHLGWRGVVRGAVLGSKRALHTVHDIEGTELHVINAHLTHQCDAQKELELERVLRLLGTLSPAVLAGDLNTTPTATRDPEMVESEHFAGDSGFELLRRASGVQLDSRVLDPEEVADVCTYPSHDPSLKLDYLLAHFDEPRYRMGPEVVLPSLISNHLPTSAEISW